MRARLATRISEQFGQLQAATVIRRASDTHTPSRALPGIQVASELCGGQTVWGRAQLKGGSGKKNSKCV
jgi:hypothetical protein